MRGVAFVAEKLSKAFGQPFVIDNRAGASGAIGAAEVARAEPDGHTMMFAADPVTTLHLSLAKSLGLEPQ